MNKQRTQGHNLERYIVKKLREIFPNLTIGTSREHSRALDNAKVDIYVKEDFPYAIQCKKHLVTTKEGKINVSELETIQSDKIKVLITRLTRKKNVKEYTVGEYALIKLEDFLYLINEPGKKLPE